MVLRCASCGGQKSQLMYCRTLSSRFGKSAAAFSGECGAGAAWLTGIVRFRALDAVRKFAREIPSDDPALGDEALEPDIIEMAQLWRSRSDLFGQCRTPSRTIQGLTGEGH